MNIRRLLAAFGFALVGSSAAHATDYPLTLENCGRTITFEAAPERVVSVGQAVTEILYQLELADRVQGTAVWRGEILPQYADVDANIERLADNDPSFEAVVAKRPDLVTSARQYHVGPKGVVGTPEQFADLGIATYIMPPDCLDRAAGGGDGARYKPFDMSLIYQTISDLAAIFDVEDRGARLVADLEARETAAKARLEAASGAGLTAVFWYSSASANAAPWVAGQNGPSGYMSRALGITNVVDSVEDWPTVGWETIARADPTIIAVANLSRRRYPMDPLEAKVAFLKSDPVTSTLGAVRNGRIVPLDPQALNPTTRVIDGLESMASAVEMISSEEN